METHFIIKTCVKVFNIVLLSFAIQFVSCSSNSDPIDTATPTSNNPPVETRTPVAPHQQPAFAGQTRVPGVESSFTINVTTVATGLNRPWGLDFLPDGRMIVSERPGIIRLVSSSGSVGSPIAGVTEVRNQSDGGLLDLKLDPDFENTRFVFWAFSEPVTGGSVNSIARGRLTSDESSFEDVTVIFHGTSPYSGARHNGVRLLFDDQERLYASFGDRYNNGIRMQAQSLDSSVGKIIRINKDGTAAEGNPFATTDGALPEIWSYGHRNPQGLAFHPETGDLWGSEHGPEGGDEINILEPGNNYGWPIIAYGLEANGQPVNGTGLTQQNGMEQPVYYWDPSIAPSGITFYTGSLIPEWQGNLFVGSLAARHLVRLVIDTSTNRIVGEEQLLVVENSRIRHITEGPDGALYTITDNSNGRILRISNCN